MACSKELDFALPPGTDAHLSYYWTMDEAGDLDKVDSTSAHVWDTATGTSSPPGLFVNGIELDCVPIFVAPFFHGLQNFADPGFEFPAGSTGVSFWFWIKQTVDPDIPAPPAPVALFDWFIECHDAPYTTEAQVDLSLGLTNTAALNCRLKHNDFTLGNEADVDFTFHPVTGAWHMIAGTLDLTNHTLNLYIDGVLTGSTVDAYNFYVTPLGDSWLKMSFAPGAQSLKVVVDEFGLSLKGALSQSQITALYNGGAGVTWPGVGAIVPFP